MAGAAVVLFSCTLCSWAVHWDIGTRAGGGPGVSMRVSAPRAKPDGVTGLECVESKYVCGLAQPWVVHSFLTVNETKLRSSNLRSLFRATTKASRALVRLVQYTDL